MLLYKKGVRQERGGWMADTSRSLVSGLSLCGHRQTKGDVHGAEESPKADKAPERGGRDISGGIGGRAAFPGRNPGQTACGEKIPCTAGC